ncbi:MAG: arginase family protein [Bacteroidales bacterium]|nr:arginase family protein [Bacteroidales bacterium]
MKPIIIIMNFTHIYEQELFLSNTDFKWIDCTGISGTSYYCDNEAVKKLTKKIAPYDPEGIHFIDSGNYHYMTKLWTDKIQHPFSLIVFDHHPDMQPSLFDNLLSCGCWVKEVLDSNPMLRKVCIAGASESLIKDTDTSYGDRLVFFSDQALNYEKTWMQFAHLHMDNPVYISVDKDVLNRKSAATNWDQGSLSLERLESLLSMILKNHEVIGIDICGECSTTLNLFESKREESLNDHANEALVQLIQNAIPF